MWTWAKLDLGDRRQHLGAPFRVLLVAILVLCATGIARGAERDTPLRETAIGQLAARLQPGEFARLTSALPPGVTRFGELVQIRVDARRRLEADSWTDSAHWDPKRHRSFFLGQRVFKKFISYDAAANAWSELGWAGRPPSPQTGEYGHTYGRTALDWKRGHYYRLSGGGLLHRYLIDEALWEEISGAPVGGYISMEWHYGFDMLVAVARGHKVFGFRDGEWKLLGKGSVEGYHSIAQYNPVRNEMMAAGGNASPRSVEIIDRGGAVHPKREAPFDISIKDHSLSYDPRSGNFLVLRRNQRELYEYAPDRDEWRLAVRWSAADWPFGNFHAAVPIEIDELGAILWQNARGPLLYRHRSAFDGAAPAAPTAAEDRRSGTAAAVPLAPPAAEGAGDVHRPSLHEVGVDAQSAVDDPASVARPPAGPRLPPPSRLVHEPGSGGSVRAAGRAGRPDEPDAAAAPPDRRGAERARHEDGRAIVPSPHAVASPAAAIVPAEPAPPDEKVEPPARLARLLETMQPGEWRAISTRLPEGHKTLYDTLSIEFCPTGSGRRTHGNGWLDSFVYDPSGRAFFVLLMRDSSEKRLAWLDADLAWHFVSNPPGVGNCAFNRRPFNRLTLVDGWLYWLPARWGGKRVEVGRFLRARAADFVAGNAGRFEPFGVGVGITSMGQAGDYAVEWFPEAAAWILHLPGNDTPSAQAGKWAAPSGHTAQGEAEQKFFRGRLFLYRPGDERWTYLDRTYSQGYRSRILYNPLRRELLVAPGGYGPGDEFTRITAKGEIIKLDRAQFDTGERLAYHTGRHNLTYDPVSGDYLLWSYDSKRIWRSRDAVNWVTYEDFAGVKFNGPRGLFGASSFIQVNPIPGTDGLIWFDPHRGVLLHRMRAPAKRS